MGDKTRTGVFRTLIRLLIFAAFLFVACLFIPTDASAKLPPWQPPGWPAELTCPTPDDVQPFPPDLAQTETVPAGTLGGSFSVSTSGDGNYTIPLVVPPGRAGMEPSLALTYDSAGGDSTLGMGFSISGFSAVTRCPKNIAQDQHIRAVQYDWTDPLCLDGKRLIYITSGPGFSEYRTFPDTFTKVLAYFPPGWDATTGPEHLRAFTKSGLAIDYGSSPDSKALANHGAVRAWWITKSSDRNGNSILYTYQNDKDPTKTYTAEIVPAEIRYTDHPNAPASRAVVFDYDKKPAAAVRTSFTRGMALTSSQLLTKVRMLGPADIEVRAYLFSHALHEATSRMLLMKIEECTADQVCKPPTTFGWNTKNPTSPRSPRRSRCPRPRWPA